jgi:hypothetical protein
VEALRDLPGYRSFMLDQDMENLGLDKANAYKNWSRKENRRLPNPA